MATTSTNVSTDVLKADPIPERELLDYSAEVKASLFRQIWKRFRFLEKTLGFSQQHLAQRLGVGKAVISRRLHGENDMRLETLSDLARGLDCRIDVLLRPFEEIEIADLHKFPFKSPASVSVADIASTSEPATPDGIVWKTLPPEREPSAIDAR